jgi:hypothetical protein
VEIRLFSVKRGLYALLDLSIDASSSLIIIAATEVYQIAELNRIVPGHKSAHARRHRLTLAGLTCPGHQFSDDHHSGPYVFVHPDILQTLNVADFPILCFNPSLIPSIAMFEPKIFVFSLLKKWFDRIQSTVPVKLFSAFNFQQHPAFPDQHNPENLCLLNQSRGL